jgi:hypothetical protein
MVGNHTVKAGIKSNNIHTVSSNHMSLLTVIVNVALYLAEFSFAVSCGAAYC